VSGLEAAFRMDVVLEDLRATVVVSGDLDLLTVPHLRPVLIGLAQDPWTITLDVDLAAVGFIDASGLGVLVTAGRVLRSRGGSLRIVNAPAGPQRVLEMAGLDRTFEVVRRGRPRPPCGRASRRRRANSLR
jgi:anti-sigma B factor antagonist